MKTGTKISLIIAALLVIFGIGIMALSLPIANRNLDISTSAQNITEEHTITENFDSINVDIDTTNITFILSEDENCRVVCREDPRTPHTVSVKDNTLWVKTEDNRKWYEHISISFDTPEVEIHLPKRDYSHLYVRGTTGDINVSSSFGFEHIDIAVTTGNIGCFASTSGDMDLKATTGIINIKNVTSSDLSLTTTTGRINADNINCNGDVAISVSTGDCELKQAACGSFTSTGSTGDLTMTSLIARDSISIERSTGDVNFHGCDAPEIKIITDTGEVEGDLLTEKIFFTESDTGNIDVPKTTRGGICEITTDTGDISITISE